MAKYEVIITSITQDIIEADNIKQAKARAEELADEIGSVEVYASKIKVKRMKGKK